MNHVCQRLLKNLLSGKWLIKSREYYQGKENINNVHGKYHLPEFIHIECRHLQPTLNLDLKEKKNMQYQLKCHFYKFFFQILF